MYKLLYPSIIGSGQRLLYRLGSGLGLVLVLVLRFCICVPRTFAIADLFAIAALCDSGPESPVLNGFDLV